MKKLITLILILVFSQVNAADYYFSQATGDDTRTAAQVQISTLQKLMLNLLSMTTQQKQ